MRIAFLPSSLPIPPHHLHVSSSPTTMSWYHDPHLKCDFCPKHWPPMGFCDQADLKQHEEDQHGDEFFKKYGERPRRYPCPHPGCDIVSTRPEHVDLHLRSHIKPSERPPLSAREQAIEEAWSRKHKARKAIREMMEKKGISWKDLDEAMGEFEGFSFGAFFTGFGCATLEHLAIVSRCLDMPIEDLREAVSFGMMIHGPPRAPDAQDNIRKPR